jgi:hypothetical protein
MTMQYDRTALITFVTVAQQSCTLQDCVTGGVVPCLRDLALRELASVERCAISLSCVQPSRSLGPV